MNMLLMGRKAANRSLTVVVVNERFESKVGVYDKQSCIFLVKR